MANLKNISEINILVRSKDRDRTQSPGNSADFRLLFPEAIYGTYRLVWATIPNTIYNVNVTNNKLYLRNADGSDTVLTLTPKNYTGTTLAAALTSMLTGVTVEYDQALLKLKFKLSNNAVHFQFYSSKPNSIHTVLGFGSSTVSTEIYQITFKGTGAVDEGTYAPNAIALGNLNSIGVRIKEASGLNWSLTAGETQRIVDINGITTKIVTGNKSHNATFIIPLLSIFGEYQSSAQDLHKQHLRFGERTRSLNIQLVNPDTMEPIDLNGADWEMLLSKTS